MFLPLFLVVAVSVYAAPAIIPEAQVVLPLQPSSSSNENDLLRNFIKKSRTVSIDEKIEFLSSPDDELDALSQYFDYNSQLLPSRTDGDWRCECQSSDTAPFSLANIESMKESKPAATEATPPSLKDFGM
jgi:hypothetical protein